VQAVTHILSSHHSPQLPFLAFMCLFKINLMIWTRKFGNEEEESNNSSSVVLENKYKKRCDGE
jgi:hypothetical protein